MKTDYEIILVGSSPVMLVEAYFNSFRYSRIAIIEKSRIGGAWAVNNYFGYQMDNGPHLMYYNFRNRLYVFNFLNKVFGIEFELFKTSPRGERRTLFINLPENSFESDQTGLLRKTYFFLHSVLTNLRHVAMMTGLMEKRYYYRPTHGSLAFSQSISKVLRERNIDFISDEVASLATKNDHVEVTLKSDKSLRCFRVIATSRMDVKGIFIEGKQRQLNYTEEEFIQMIILIKDVVSPNFSYYKFFKHPHIFIAANISNTADRDLEANTFIVGLALNKAISMNTVPPPAFFLTELKKRKMVSSEASLLGSEMFRYESRKLTDQSSHQIQESSKGLIEIISYNNIMTGLESVLQKRRFQSH